MRSAPGSGMFGAGAPAPALASPGWDRGGAAEGVGSRVTQPNDGNHTSTQEWASRSRTTYSFSVRSSAPVVKPAATRAGTPPMRSSSAIAPLYCWQKPTLASKRKPSSVLGARGGVSE